MEWLLLAAALALIALSGLFVAAEFSFVTVSRTAIDTAVAEGAAGASGVQAALRSLSTQLSAAQVGITITNLLIGWVAEPSIATLLRGPLTAAGVPDDGVPAVSLTAALVLAAVLTMVFGELVPQNLALAHPYGVARFVQRPQRWFAIASRPLTVSLNGLSNRIVRLLGVEPQEELASARTPEELAAVVRSSAQSGHLAEPTADLVTRSLRFDELQAQDVLTPRTRMVWVDAADPVQKVIDLCAEHGYSRYPVAAGDPDQIVGMVELSQAVGIPSARRPRTRVGELATPVLSVPGTTLVDELLWALRDRDEELAVVVDEYAGTAGIVTFEDLLEEITGPIDDEHDSAVELVQEVDGAWLVSGLLRPDELYEVARLRLPANPRRYETLAGLVLYRLGRIPQAGDQVDVNGIRIRVLRMDGRRIDQLAVGSSAQDEGMPVGDPDE
jgi:CBS domain containing-hemolysin-like protein